MASGPLYLICMFGLGKSKWRDNLKALLTLLCVPCRLGRKLPGGEGGEATWLTPAQWAAKLGWAMGHAGRVSKGTGGISWPACGARWVVAWGHTNLLWGPFSLLTFLPSRSPPFLSDSVMRIRRKGVFFLWLKCQKKMFFFSFYGWYILLFRPGDSVQLVGHFSLASRKLWCALWLHFFILPLYFSCKFQLFCTVLL